MANKIWGSNNEPLKIQFITDTHYYSRKGGTEGKAYDKAESKSQKVIKDSDLVIKAGFGKLDGTTLIGPDKIFGIVVKIVVKTK